MTNSEIALNMIALCGVLIVDLIVLTMIVLHKKR